MSFDEQRWYYLSLSVAIRVKTESPHIPGPDFNLYSDAPTDKCFPGSVVFLDLQQLLPNEVHTHTHTRTLSVLTSPNIIACPTSSIP